MPYISILLGLISLALFFVVLYFLCKRHTKFIKRAKSIKQGMFLKQVLEIMYDKPTIKEYLEDKSIYIWEKNQWKGLLHSGTLTRAVKVTIENDIVVAKTTKNLDKSVFW